MAIKEITLPNADARPRRIAHHAGRRGLVHRLHARHIGRYDPKTGQIKEWPSPGGTESEPYGIATVGSIVWYSESNVRPNTLVRFDPATEKFQTWAIPSGGHVVRNMMRTKNGNLVLAESGINKVALVEVARGSNAHELSRQLRLIGASAACRRGPLRSAAVSFCGRARFSPS